ncbi:hypothetical protein H102_07039 [Trichophyton rubrum CBS 100081]|nr:hypothetical protein H102_07039 [Trichophyton rubrum CBS 100081]
MTHRANLLTSYSRTGEEATDWHPSVQRLEPPHIVMETLVLGWQSYPPVLYSHRPIYNRLVARHHPPDSIRTGQNSEVFTRHRIMVSESQIISPFLSLPLSLDVDPRSRHRSKQSEVGKSFPGLPGDLPQGPGGKEPSWLS